MVSKRSTRVGALALAAGLTSAMLVASSASAIPNNNSAKKLTSAVTADGVTEHLEALQVTPQA